MAAGVSQCSCPHTCCALPNARSAPSCARDAARLVAWDSASVPSDDCRRGRNAGLEAQALETVFAGAPCAAPSGGSRPHQQLVQRLQLLLEACRCCCAALRLGS